MESGRGEKDKLDTRGQGCGKGEGGMGKRAGRPRSDKGDLKGNRPLLQVFAGADFGEDAHLLDGDGIEFLQALGLGEAVVDQDGIDVFQIG